MASPVFVYGDLMSQPMRAVLWFCLLNDIPHTIKPIKLAQKEHLVPEYKQMCDPPRSFLPVL